MEAKQAFEKLFTHKSAQLSSQQEANIKEYIFVHKVSDTVIVLTCCNRLTVTHSNCWNS